MGYAFVAKSCLKPIFEKWLLVAIYFFMFSLLTACGGGNGKTPEEQLEENLQSVRSIRSTLVTEAGNSSIPLRSLQSVELGDVYTYNNSDRSIDSRSSSVLDDVVELSEISDIHKLNQSVSINVDFLKDQEIGLKTDLPFLDNFLSAAFKMSSVHKLIIEISVNDASVRRLKDPFPKIESFQKKTGLNNVKGNIVITGIVSGRLKIRYYAYDKKSEEIDIDKSKLLDLMNTTGVGTIGVDASDQEQSSTNTVIAAEESATQFAVITQYIDSDYIDDYYVDVKIYGDRIYEYYWQYNIYNDRNTKDTVIAIFKIKQTFLDNDIDNAKWHLSIKNVDTQDRTISSPYIIRYYDDDDNYIFYFEDKFLDLMPDEERNIGYFSSEPAYLGYGYITIGLSNIVYEAPDEAQSMSLE